MSTAVDANDSLTSDVDGTFDDEEEAFPVEIVFLTVCCLAVVSEFIVLVICRGVSGNLGGRVLLGVQGASEILQQLMLILILTCVASDGENCVDRMSLMSCKLFNFFVGLFFYLPDWLAVAVALDRLIAWAFPLWYMQNCTLRNAWAVTSVITLIIGAVAVPRPVFSELNWGFCQVTYETYENFLKVSGVPAVALVALLTSVLVIIILAKRSNSDDRLFQTMITTPMLLSSALFAVFGAVKYGLIFYSVLVEHTLSFRQVIFLGSIGRLVGSLGVSLRGPLLLTMEGMRTVAREGVKCGFNNHTPAQ